MVDSVRSFWWSRRFAKCGKKLKVFGRVKAVAPQSIEVGQNCNLNEGVQLFARRDCGIVIGDNVTLSPNVTIISSGYDVNQFMESNNRIHTRGNCTLVGDYVWLCTNVIVLGGVQISGHHVIVAAGSVVNHDITENYCLYAGTPATLKKFYHD